MVYLILINCHAPLGFCTDVAHTILGDNFHAIDNPIIRTLNICILNLINEIEVIIVYELDNVICCKFLIAENLMRFNGVKNSGNKVRGKHFSLYHLLQENSCRVI